VRPADELAAEVLRRGAPLWIKARGASMLPFMWDGDVVLVAPTPWTAVGVGDVVCYETSPGRLVLHRVIERTDDRAVTKGDALMATEAIEPAQLLGKVTAIERHGRITRLDGRRARWRTRMIVSAGRLIPALVAATFGLRRAVGAALRD
jgi:hypothetical protein